MQVLPQQFPERAELELIGKGVADLAEEEAEEVHGLLQQQLSVACVMRDVGGCLAGVSAPMYGELIDGDV